MKKIALTFLLLSIVGLSGGVALGGIIEDPDPMQRLLAGLGFMVVILPLALVMALVPIAGLIPGALAGDEALMVLGIYALAICAQLLLVWP